MAANRAKNKIKKEEKKRKEAAEVIKAETTEEKEEEKSGIVAAATAKPSEKPQSAPKGKIRQYVNDNPQSAYKAPNNAPATSGAKPAGTAASKPQTVQTATGTSKETPSFSSLKKPGAAGGTTQTNTQSRVFERKDAAPIYFKESDTATKKTDANKNVNKSNDSVTSAALKTRVWIRDDD